MLAIAVVVLTFNSFRLSLIAFLAAGPIRGAVAAGACGLQLPFGINAIIGLIGSIGVSINAALIAISALQDDEAAAQGDQTAMAEVVLDASRHILSTAITTFGGFLPLIQGGWRLLAPS
ncbi:hypothetical protein [Falsiroseomonas sp. E2-1-a4]|uniref:hypothetical protein n=1 Tax=Falsiroseomonas sp. E2-1-a4 TaxID=3239299 RepID=UPI003F2A5FCB